MATKWDAQGAQSPESRIAIRRRLASSPPVPEGLFLTFILDSGAGTGVRSVGEVLRPFSGGTTGHCNKCGAGLCSRRDT